MLLYSILVHSENEIIRVSPVISHMCVHGHACVYVHVCHSVHVTKGNFLKLSSHLVSDKVSLFPLSLALQAYLPSSSQVTSHPYLSSPYRCAGIIDVVLPHLGF